jgi:hypothetical protein
MLRKLFPLALAVVLLTSCETVQTLLTQAAGSGLTTSGTTINNAAGLKEALNVGITKAVAALSAENGYFKDAALKILLPSEASTILKNVKLIPGGQALVDNVVLRLNRAAEDAAAEAKPIFVSAIRNMTFADATKILFGSDTAATNYLRKATYAQLKAAFKPQIAASLDKDLVGTMSTNESWSTLTSHYNKVAVSAVGKVAGLKTVTTSLTDYATDRALDGLFLKMGAEEKNIRQNPSARVNTLLQKVFGQLDRK